jgi:4-amino-4-deoxy-L-arabinose transferase-like glycosyltransferase
MTSLVTWLRTVSVSAWTALAACCVALALAHQTLHGRSVDYDEGVYWQSLRAMADGHLLFSSVFSSQPPLFLLSIYPFYLLFGKSIIAARLALVVFSVAGVIGTYIAGRALGHRTIGAVACLLLALDPIYETAAHVLQAELPSIVLQIWAVACAALSMHANERRRAWLALSSGILLGCASLIKLFAIAALVPVVMFLCAPFFQRLHDNRSHRQTARDLIQAALLKTMPLLGLLAAGLLGATIAMLLPFIGRLDDVYDQVVRMHLVAGQFDRRPMHAELWQLAEQLGSSPLVYVAALASLVIAWRPMWVSVPLILWALAAFVVLLHVRPLFDHHIVLLSPALALISGCGAAVALQEFQSPGAKRLGLAATLALLAVASGTGLLVNLRQSEMARRPPSASELDMVKALQTATAPGDVVLSDNQYVAALANRDVPPQMVDTSFVRIKSGYLTTAQLKDLITYNRIPAILFATGRLDELTGFRAWVAQRYSLAATFGKDKSLFLLGTGIAR